MTGNQEYWALGGRDKPLILIWWTLNSGRRPIEEQQKLYQQVSLR